MSWLPKKSVVVPFDFSDESAKAIESASELVAEPANLHIIHVLYPILVSEPGVLWQTIDEDARRKHVEDAFRNTAVGKKFPKATLAVRLGDPGREIADFAAQVKAELIVMPSHGRTGLGRLLIGSVAERVVRLAHCPVLILK